jgi:DNA-binding beta-propeller fold protein YncE
VVQTLPVGSEPALVAVNRLSGEAYVSLHGAGRVAVIDRAGTVSQVDLYSAGPYGVAVDTQRNLVYVATIEIARIAVLDGSTDTFLGWVEVRETPGGALVPLRMVAIDPLVGTSGHLFVTTAGSDGGWDKLLVFSKGWPESLGQPYTFDLDEPREGIAFDLVAFRVWVTSRAGDRLIA